MENIGWGWKRWKLWCGDREIYDLIHPGVETAHTFHCLRRQRGLGMGPGKLDRLASDGETVGAGVGAWCEQRGDCERSRLF
jgi:hypothetical protein